MTDRAVPNLPSREFAATIAFYAALGFDVDHRSDDWLIMRRGDAQLEFFPHPALDPLSSSFMCSLRLDDVDELYRRALAAGIPEADAGYPRLHPVTAQPWGQRAGFLTDLDGTQLHLIDNGGRSDRPASPRS